MKIEADAVEILGGVRFGKTLGAPVSLLVRNLDFAAWKEAMASEGDIPVMPPHGS
jgi:chorismate synthase